MKKPIQTRPLNEDRRSFIDFSEKSNPRVTVMNSYIFLDEKNLKLAQLLDNKIKRSKLTFQGGILSSWHNGLNFDFWKECIDVQKEMKAVDLLNCRLFDLQV